MTAMTSDEAPGAAVSDTEKDAGETLFDPALLTFRYPYQRETTLPAKLTATQLKGRALDQEIAEDAYHTPYIRPLVQPKFRREKKGLTPAERGTATPSCLAVSGSAKFGCARTGGEAAGWRLS
ncbi:MAG: hypothetical protein ACLSHO_08640 [Dysosmobacter sp.]